MSPEQGPAEVLNEETEPPGESIRSRSPPRYFARSYGVRIFAGRLRLRVCESQLQPPNRLPATDAAIHDARHSASSRSCRSRTAPARPLAPPDGPTVRLRAMLPAPMPCPDAPRSVAPRTELATHAVLPLPSRPVRLAPWSAVRRKAPPRGISASGSSPACRSTIGTTGAGNRENASARSPNSKRS